MYLSQKSGLEEISESQETLCFYNSFLSWHLLNYFSLCSPAPSTSPCSCQDLVTFIIKICLLLFWLKTKLNGCLSSFSHNSVERERKREVVREKFIPT